jgi:hypothetical protein
MLFAVVMTNSNDGGKGVSGNYGNGGDDIQRLTSTDREQCRMKREKGIYTIDNDNMVSLALYIYIIDCEFVAMFVIHLNMVSLFRFVIGR